MKNRTLKTLGIFAALFGLALPAPSTFAANPWNISYSGGAELSSSNVIINQNLVDGLTPVIKDNLSLSFSNSSKWKNGYVKAENGQCNQVKYFKVWSNDTIKTSDNLAAVATGKGYKLTMSFLQVALDGVSNVSENSAIAMVVNYVNGSATIGKSGPHAASSNSGLFSNSTCTTRPSDIKYISSANDGLTFVRTKLQLERNNQAFNAKKLFFGLTDVDAAQSYKILNEGNLLTGGASGNMYALSEGVLQPAASVGTTLKNMFVSSGNYIYSQYDNDGHGFNIPGNDANVFVELNSATQSSGLDMVFGFAGDAASTIQYYAEQYKVEYTSDDNGTITDITNEEVVAGENPTGSLTKPNECYAIDYWTANGDVTLKNGAVIKKGDKITAEQVKQVVVNQDYVFTAHHKPNCKDEAPVATPDTGTFTGDSNAAFIPASIAGVILGAVVVGLLPRLMHKKIGFKK